MESLELPFRPVSSSSPADLLSDRILNRSALFPLWPRPAPCSPHFASALHNLCGFYGNFKLFLLNVLSTAVVSECLHCLHGMPRLVSGQVQHLQEATKAATVLVST